MLEQTYEYNQFFISLQDIPGFREVVIKGITSGEVRYIIITTDGGKYLLNKKLELDPIRPF